MIQQGVINFLKPSQPESVPHSPTKLFNFARCLERRKAPLLLEISFNSSFNTIQPTVKALVGKIFLHCAFCCLTARGSVADIIFFPHVGELQSEEVWKCF